MKISVVIPAHNEELFLPKTLKSLSEQTFKLPYEIIVVDNKSTDKTAEIAATYGAVVVKEEKKGFAHACNAGFLAAKGDIIARADADYILPKKWLDKIWKAFQKDKLLIALGGPIYPLESYWWENILYFPAQLTWMYMLKLLGQGFLFPNMAVRRKIFLECGGFDTDIPYGEDTDLCQRLKKMGKVKLFPNIYVYTSLRRLRAMGLVNFFVKFAVGNEIAKYSGKPPIVGLEIVRELPKQQPKPQIPWPYLVAGPLLLVALLTLGINVWLSSLTPPASITQLAGKELKKLNLKEAITSFLEPSPPKRPNY